MASDRDAVLVLRHPGQPPVQWRLPQATDHLDQDREWCEIHADGSWERLRFHDYDRIYEVPGLYEALFYETLECSSPQRVGGLLSEVLKDHRFPPHKLRVLDVGAGNGMVGEELQELGATHLTGVDIIPEARDATLRDRPDLYDSYLVTDLTDLPEDQEKLLRQQRLNCLSTVAALGYGDIPARAFLTALDVIDTPGWVAFNIKERFLYESDTTGFAALIDRLRRDRVLRIEAFRRYRHRLSLDGQPLHYVAMVAAKLRNVPDEYLEKTDA
jgi:SAM-dependent methyltransferase